MLPRHARRRRPLRPEPERAASSRQPAHRAAGVVFRALARRLRFLLRIEDLDPQRSRASTRPAPRRPRRARHRLGRRALRQSEQLERHRAAFERLRDDGRLYRCWCTRAEIREAAQAPHGARRRLPRHLPRAERRASATPRAKRARRVRGALTRAAQGVGVRRAPRRATPAARRRRLRRLARGPAAPASAAPAYNLAVVVDDAAEGVGEVVRGDDLLETTPRQILLARALGLAGAELRPRAAGARPATAGGWPSATAPSRSPSASRAARASRTSSAGWPRAPGSRRAERR